MRRGREGEGRKGWWAVREARLRLGRVVEGCAGAGELTLWLLLLAGGFGVRLGGGSAGVQVGVDVEGWPAGRRHRGRKKPGFGFTACEGRAVRE